MRSYQSVIRVEDTCLTHSIVLRILKPFKHSCALKASVTTSISEHKSHILGQLISDEYGLSLEASIELAKDILDVIWTSQIGWKHFTFSWLRSSTPRRAEHIKVALALMSKYDLVNWR
jgi:hypothetical protein